MEAKLEIAMLIQEPFRLVYTFGDAYDPGNRHGSVVLQLFGDGRALLDNAFGGAFTKSWEGLVERPTLERILAQLDGASFPRVADHPIPIGSTLRVILIQSGAEEMHNAPIAWAAGAEMPGYREAFAILDSLAAELSGGAIRNVKLVEKGLARRADKPIRPSVAVADAFELGCGPAAAASLLAKYGLDAEVGSVGGPERSLEVGWAAETIVSGMSAEAFGLGRAVGAVRRLLEEGSPDGMGDAFNLLRSSRHEPARQLADLARQAPADFRPRLEELTQALRRAIGA